MSWKKIAIAVVLADFVALSLYAVSQVGYLGIFESMLTNMGTIQIGADLIIALGLVLLWMVRDAREHGLSPMPYVVLTLLLGSIGPLVYLLRRPEESTVAAPHLARAS
ncbi:MAG: DUF2834 domain-containing protein [Deltaproteobacteria bacterium]|nr:DUF2834 domain-containing protein [Deltaproteobacteria bacterium]